jgi:hypothetical protein
MKKPFASKMKLYTWAMLAAALSGGSLAAAPASPAPKAIQIPHSTFIIPTSPKEGCDPFFPSSTRLYDSVAPTHIAAVTSLLLRGISGPPGHRLVIINNHTFADGDQGDVAVPGGKIHVRCIEIKAASVVVEAGGQRRELTFSNN